MLLDEFIKKLKLIRTRIDGNSKINNFNTVKETRFVKEVVFEKTLTYKYASMRKRANVYFDNYTSDTNPLTLDELIRICEEILTEYKDLEIFVKSSPYFLDDVYYTSKIKFDNNSNKLVENFVNLTYKFKD